MDGALELFDIDGTSMRFGVTEDDRPYVVAEDFTPKLGYSRARDALRMVDDDEKGAQIVRTPGGPQEMAVLYEDGIWELIFQSRRPEAKAIKTRVKEILRTIRKTGRYEVTPELDELEVARRYVAALESKRELEARVAELEPKAAAVDAYVEAYGKELLGTVAKKFGMRESVLRRFCHDEGLLIAHGNRRNDPTSEYGEAGAGWFVVESRVVGPEGRRLAANTTFVTPKGVEGIRARLAKRGVTVQPYLIGADAR